MGRQLITLPRAARVVSISCDSIPAWVTIRNLALCRDKNPTPACWQQAVAARVESGGIIDMVSDAEILAAQRLLAAGGGIFGEPASAASLAGLIKLAKSGTDFSQKRVVCVITGTGLKDTDTALKGAEPFLEVPADSAAVEQALGWG